MNIALFVIAMVSCTVNVALAVWVGWVWWRAQTIWNRLDSRGVVARIAAYPQRIERLMARIYKATEDK